VRPIVSRKYALGDAKEALRALEDGHVTGKLVLDLAGAVAGVPDPIYWPGA